MRGGCPGTPLNSGHLHQCPEGATGRGDHPKPHGCQQRGRLSPVPPQLDAAPWMEVSCQSRCVRVSAAPPSPSRRDPLGEGKVAQRRPRQSGAVRPRRCWERRCHRVQVQRASETRGHRGAGSIGGSLQGPARFLPSSPALAYRLGRARGDPALPSPDLPLPAAPGKLLAYCRAPTARTAGMSCPEL